MYIGYLKIKSALLFVLFVLIFQKIIAQDNPELQIKQQSIEFDHLYFEDENDYYSVEDITTDPYGFVWFAAKEGVFRYDGQHFLSFDSPQYEISNQRILGIAQNKDSSLWVLSTHKIYRINTRNFAIKTFSVDFKKQTHPGNPLRGEIYIDNNILYAGFWGGGFLIMDLENYKMQHFFYDKNDFPIPSNTITSIRQRDENSLWVGTHDGLFIFFKETNTFQAFKIKFPDKKQQPDFNQINTICESSEGYLWLGTNSGLMRVNPVNRNTKTFQFTKSQLADYEKNIVESITFDATGKLWIGTRYGIYYYNPVEETFKGFFHEKYNPESLQTNYVRKVFIDNNNILWIGHHGGTVSKYAPRKKKFSAYTLISDFVGDLRVFSLFKEKRNIWFGTETGLYKYNRQKKQLKRYSHNPDNPHSLSHNLVSGIKKDNSGTFWISTDKGGLNRFNPETEKFTNILSGSYELASYSESDIWSIMLGKNNKLWCGTGGSGLLRVNTLSRKITAFINDSKRPNSLSGNFIGPIVEYKNNLLWVGTSNKGLNLFNPETDTAQHFFHHPGNSQSLKSNTVISLCLTNNDKLWIGTSQGVSILDTKNFTIDNSLINQLDHTTIEAIHQDANENMWIATGKGLYMYDKSKQVFQYYLESDGISNNRFISGSSYQANDGELFFGSMQGFTCFYPYQIKNNKHIPPVYITDLKVLGESVMYEEQFLCDFEDNNIELNYKQNNLSFSFAGLDYFDPEKNRFAIKLEGFDSDWKLRNENQQVNYNNLPPGHYTFRVKASNNDNVWNQKGDYLNIYIRPPFWETLAFRIGLVVFIIAGIYVLINMRIRSIKNQKIELERIVENRTKEVKTQKENIEKKHLALEKQKSAIEHQAIQLATINKKLEEQQKEIRKQAEELREMNRLKSRFFANVSHEFRTPLTLILNSISELKKTRKNTEKEQKNIQILERNSYRLLRLIDQLLDLTKIESGFMGLSVSEGNIQRFTYEIVDAFYQKAQSSGINFSTQMNEELQTIFADWDKLEKIFYNLLSNAFKFTEKGGKVTLMVNWEDDKKTKLKITVADSGCGIPKALHEKIFSRFYRSETSHTESKPGTGIGLALTKQLIKIHKGEIKLKSEPGKGAVFTAIIPCSKNYFAENEIISKKQLDVEFIHSHILTTETLTKSSNTKQKTAQQKASLLFIDDNVELCNQVKDSFAGFFDVITAYDGQEGFHKAIEEMPDIIVSDIMMPKISGIDLCQKLKKDIRTDHLSFILLTAKKDEQSQMQALNIGADDYITKPFSMNALALKIKNQLNTRKMMEQKLVKEFVNIKHLHGQQISNSFLNKAIKIIEDNIEDTQFGINNLAEKLNMSRTQLYRKFNSLISIPVNEFIKDVKLKKAHQLLTTGEYNISEVAAHCGFNTPGYFSRCFEQKYGILPSKFLSQQKR